MASSSQRIVSRRKFCLCCAAATTVAASGEWLTPRQAFAEARPKKLAEIANELGVSRERERQIELSAFAKLRKVVRAATTPPLQKLTAA
jgi:Sigma-70, region 4